MGARSTIRQSPSFWFPVHGPKQDGSGTPGQVSCSEIGEFFVLRRSYEPALTTSTKFNLAVPATCD